MKKYRKRTGNPYDGPMILSNNARRRRGLPTYRKTDGRRRYYTRNEARETVAAFLEYCNNVESYRTTAERYKAN